MARKKRKEEAFFEKQVDQIANRLQSEHKEEGRWEVRTILIPIMGEGADAKSVNVKIAVSIKDKFFYCRGITAHFSAGTEEWREAKFEPDKSRLSDSVDMDEWAIILANIPLETRIIFYLDLLDKSGETLRDDNDGKFYQFTTEPGGMIGEDSDWDDDRLIKCTVCGYMCRPEWDECPACNTPLDEFQTRQEIFVNDQEQKEEEREKEKDDDSWKWAEAQQTDEIWRGLPECPSCGSAVQPEWLKCPICNFDLSSVDLEKKGIYEDEFDDDDVEVL